MKKALSLALIAGLFVASPALAKLEVGSDAPSLHIKEWIKGDAVKLSDAKDDQVFVVEFWATWCGPCRAVMPHMSEMQEHFKDKGVTCISISDESKEIVTKFLENGFDKVMRYTVAIDDNRKTNNAWMKASGQQGIPTAFIVQGGKIKWIGHPGMGLDTEVAKLVGDKDYLQKKEKMEALSVKLQNAASAEEWQKVHDIMSELIALDSKNFSLKFAKYHLMATKLGKKEDAANYGKSIVDASESADELNMFAWQLLTNEEFEEARDNQLAKAAAEKALKLSKEKDASIVDTYARSLAETGDLSGAIKWQTKAIDLAEDKDMKAELEKALKEYQERLEKQRA